MNARVVATLIGLVFWFHHVSFGATLTWTNTAGGSWTNAANWNPNQVPASADQAVITNAGNYNITVPGVTTVGALTLGAGSGSQSLEQTNGTFTLNGEARILPGGSLTWISGAANGPITISPSGSLQLDGTATKSIYAPVTNRGTIQIAGAGEIYLYGSNGARIENEGLFEFLADRDVYGINGSPAFRNTGTIRKSAGTGNGRLGASSAYPVVLDNLGLIESQSGVLQLFGGGTLAGQLVTATGARIELVGGTFTQPAVNVPVVSGAGNSLFTGGTLRLLNSIPNLQLTGGTVVPLPTFQDSGSITNLVLDGASLNGTNKVTGTLRWRDGTIGGVLTIASNGVFIAEGTVTKTWNAAVTNRGIFQFGGTGEIYMYGNNGARMVNEGLFEFLADRALYGINGSPPFSNTGTIRKSAGTGTCNLGVPGSYPVVLDNFGLIESQSGVLQLFGGGTLGGQIMASTTARVEFVGGTWTQTAANVPVVSGAGSSRFTGGTLILLNSISNLQLTGGTVLLLPTFQDGGSITNLTLDGATLSGTNTVTGTLRWRDGTIGGVLTIASNGVFIAEGTVTKTWYAAVTNRGTFQFGGTGEIYMYGNNGARMVNEGLFEFIADRALYGINGNPPFSNTGTIRKSAGTGTCNLGVPGSYPVVLDNLGLIESQSGVLQLFGGGILGGQIMASATARVELVGGTWTQLAPNVPVVSGAGSVRLTGGTLRLLNTVPNLQLTGGTVTLLPEFQNGGAITNLVLDGATLNGTNTLMGTLRWRDGTIGGVLTIASNGVLIAEGTVTKTWNAAVTNRGIFQFGGTGEIYMYGNNGARMVNEGLFEFLADRALYGISGNPPFSNTGTIRKSAGTGTCNLGVPSSYPVVLDNFGVIESQVGVLQLFGGGTLAGQLVTASNARIELVGGTWTQPAANVPVVSGAGSSRFTGGTLRLLNSIPNLQLTGGTVVLLPAFQAAGAITNLALQGSTLAGTNTVIGSLVCQSVSGPLTILAGGTVNWNDGTLTGPVVVASNAVLTLSTTSIKALNGPLTNHGQVFHQSSGSLYLYGNNGAQVENAGLWDTQGDGAIYGISGNPLFRNRGELRKSAGTGSANLGVASSYPVSFENLGVVTVLSGVQQFFGNGPITGAFSTLPGTRVEFVGGTWTQPVAGAGLFTGGGEARFTGGTIRLLDRIPNLRLTGGTAVLLPDFQAAGAITNLFLEGTTLSGTNLVLGSLTCQSVTGPLNIAPGGLVNWTDGTFAGPVLVESNAVLTLSTTSIKVLTGSLTNHGQVLHQASSLYLYGNNGARIETTGFWEIQGDSDTYGINGFPTFRNTGLLRKSSGTGSASIGVASSYPVAFENRGTVETVFGTMSFFGSSALSNGTVRVAMRSLTDYGRLNFASAVTLGGTLGAYLVGGYQPVVGNKFTVVSFNSASNLFTDEELPDGIVWQTDYAAANVSLTVLGACTPAPQALAAWWPAEGTTDEAVANNDGVLRNGATFASGKVGQAFSLDGQNDYVEVPDSNLWAFGTNDFSVALWASLRNVRSSTLGNPAAIFIGQSPGAGNLDKWFFALGGGMLNMHLNGPGPGPRFVAQTAFSPATNTWYHLAFSRSNGVYRVFTNGVPAVSQADATPIPNIAAPLTIGSAEGAGFVDGLLDEIIVVNRALSVGEISAIYASGNLGLCRPTQPPLIVNQPQGRTNAPDTIATFTVAAAGSSPLSYQWQFNGAPLSNGGRISGAQSSVLSIASVQPGDAGPYRVTVSNAAGSTNSFPAQLVVDGAGPVISQVSTNVGQTQCIISWQTDEPATSVIEYGPTGSYGTTNRFNGALGTSHTMTLSSLTPGLKYHFRIRSADSVSNETVTTDLTFDTLPAPDLSPTIVSATSVIQVGQSFTVIFIITNSGSATAGGAWQNTLLIANAPDGSGAQNVASATFNPGPGGLPAGASVTVTQTVLFPNLSTGTRYVGVRVDSSSQVVEVSESNNTAYLAVPVLVTATDLRVARVTGPGSALFGQSINVQFVVTNAGSAAAPFAWTDRLYLSSFSNSISGATLLSTATSPVPSLAAGKSYTNAASFSLPLSAQSSPGAYYLVLSADNGNAITESTEDNNLGATPLAVTLPPLPDLVVRNITAPTNAVPGQTLAISWVVTNQGTLMATGVWSETIYLATNTAGAGALELGNFIYTNTILISGSIARTQSVVVPINSPLGSLWTVVRVDSGGDITEGNETNNLGAAANPTIIPAVLTLQANAAQVAEGAAQPVHFTVTRNGSRAAALTVSIAIPDSTELLASSNVVIVAGQASAAFDVYGQLDGIVDGPQVATVQVSAPGFQSASANLTVLDVDVPHLMLTLSTNTILEGQTVSATIYRDAATTNNPATVTVVSSNPNQLLAPIPFTIPAGVTSVMIALLAVDDSLIENVGSYVVSASAPGYVGASASVLVVDDDLPELTFDLASPTISEGAGSQATLATITRNIVNSRTLELDLESGNTNAARVPPRVVIPGSAASVSFPVAAVDNDLVDGPKSVQLRVWIRATGLALRLAEGPSVNLTVTDNDGPTLRLVIDRDLAGEGANPAAHATVSRNTATNNTLVVSLASSDTTELTAPGTVTIPAGANSATFALATVDDGTTDGNQVVTVTASAPGFTSGTDQITVTDVNLPDLIVAGITAPAVAETESFVSIGYQLRNQGVSPASSNAIVQRVYLSPDPLVGDDILIGQFTFNGGLSPDTQFGQAFSARMPQAPGDYWVIVDGDVNNAVPEILEQNNTRVSSAPIHVVTAYDAEVSTTLETAPAGTPVPFTGHAFGTNGAGAPFALVNIHIYVRDTHRIIAALADALGNFSATWQPLPGEAGSYTVGAAHPGVQNAPVQDSFTLHGIKASPSSLSLTVAEQSSLGGVIQLVNQSALPLSAVQAEILSKPANLNVTIALQTNFMAGLGTNFLSYGMTALDASVAQGQVLLRVTSGEGAVVEVPISVRVEALRPRLVASPQQLSTGVKRGGQRLVEFQVANAGGAPSGPISVSLPPIPWLGLISPNPLPSLAPGETNSVTLSLTPDDDQPLTVFNGNLALNAVGAGLSVPFEFRLLSEARGDLKVTAVDEFTYYAAGAPRVSNATVVVRDTISRAVITNGVTDGLGELFVPQLMEGYYDIEVSADRHNSYRNTHLILSGTTNEVSTFISRQTVRYTWTVERIEIEDRYRITIETEFEANVPAPVVTISPPVIDVADVLVVGQVKQVNMTIENHGLIAVDDTRLSFGTHPFYLIEPLIKDIGRLGAKSSLTIPVTVRRIGTFASASGGFQAASGGGGAPCGMSGDLSYDFECGPLKISGGSAVGVSGVQGDCGGGPGGGGSGGPGGSSLGIGGGGSGPGGGSVNTAYSSFEIGLKIGCDPTCLVLAGLGCIPGPIGCFFGGVSCGKGLAEDGVQAIDVADCAIGAAGCLGPPPVAAAACAYAIVRCFISPAGAGASGGMFLAASASSADPLNAFKPGVRAMLDSFNELTGTPDGVWFNPQANTDMGLWIARFQAAAGPGSDGGRTITQAERAGLLVGVQPPGVALTEIIRFLDRWNRSLQNWANGILRPADAPPGANHDFIDAILLKERLILAGQYNEQAVAAGFTDPINAIVETVRFRAAAGEGGGTCARVRLKIDQQAVVSREAFRATLEFDNGDATSVEGIGVELRLTDPSGNNALALFGIAPPVLTGLGDINGGGSLAVGAKGTAKWTIIPTVDAAPLAPTNYFVSGVLRYRLNGVAVTIPLAPYEITVHPVPRLTVQYFHERDVFSDDPHTDEIEPSIPFNLAVMVLNKGAGAAKNFHITSAQPEIIENEKGLLIDFRIIATQVAGQNLSPSLTANFGNIGPGSNGIARWLMTSTLQGLFINYSATFEHIDGLGNPKLSLIDDVSIHEMNRLVQAGGSFEDGKPDFLVNDRPDLRDYPDTLYLSDGTTNAVEVVTNAVVTGALSGGNLQIQISAALPGGWAYLRIPDPGNGLYRLASVRRSDNGIVAVNTNAWVTARTFYGQGTRPVSENILHLLDYNSTGTYTLTYQLNPAADTQAPSSAVAALTPASGAAIVLNWAGQDNAGGSGIAFYDIYVSENGGPFQRWLSATPSSAAVYQGDLGKSYAFYSVAVDVAGNREEAPGSPDAQTTVTRINRAPVLGTVADVTIVERDTVALDIPATDPDGDDLSFSLLPGAPVGMVLNSYSGRLTWITGEGHGPSTNQVTVRVRDSGVPQFATTVSFKVIVLDDNEAPSLAPIENRIIGEGGLLTVNTSATDPDLPPQALTYSLSPGAPAGAAINPTTGVFSWRPSNIQGGTTNTITVIVTDAGVPALSASQSFQVIVRDTRADFVVSIGTTNVLAGQGSAVPVMLASSLDLTNLSFLLEADASRLTNFLLTPLAPGITSATLAPAGINLSELRFLTSAGTPLLGNVLLGRVDFTATMNPSSAVVPIDVRSLTGVRGTGEIVRNAGAKSGRVVVIGNEIVLVGLLDPQRRVAIYGRPGLCVSLQSNTNLNSSAWKTVGQYTLSGQSEFVTLPPVTSGAVFYRAMLCDNTSPILTLRVEANRTGTLILSGQSGAQYLIQQKSSLLPNVNWGPLTNISLIGTNGLIPGLSLTNAARFFRAVGP